MVNSPPACLVPGAGLGRLALEISSRGVHTLQLLKFLFIYSYSMLTVSHPISRFHLPGKWIFILHDDMLKFYSQWVRIHYSWSKIIFRERERVFSFQIVLSNVIGPDLFISCQTAGEWTIYPWIHSNCNSLSDDDQLRPIPIPDIHPARYSCCYSWSFVFNSATEALFWLYIH